MHPNNVVDDASGKIKKDKLLVSATRWQNASRTYFSIFIGKKC
jgi:hypothetical protein